VAILVISHAACFLVGGSIGFVLAAICAMAADKYAQSHNPDERSECRGPTTEDQTDSDLARLTGLLY
jgi:hypothetical protein